MCSDESPYVSVIWLAEIHRMSIEDADLYYDYVHSKFFVSKIDLCLQPIFRSSYLTNIKKLYGDWKELNAKADDAVEDIKVMLSIH